MNRSYSPVSSPSVPDGYLGDSVREPDKQKSDDNETHEFGSSVVSSAF